MCLAGDRSSPARRISRRLPSSYSEHVKASLPIADNRMSRSPGWIAVDVLMALVSSWIAVSDSTVTASVFHGPVVVRCAAASWFLAISLRRLGPVTALWVASIATVAVVAVQYPVTNLSVASVLALALVSQTHPRGQGAVLAVVPVLAVSGALFLQPEDGGTTAFTLSVALHAGAWLYGESRRLRLIAEENRRRLEIEHLQSTEAARRRRDLLNERARLARELHDAVGHAVTVMVTHAG